MNIDKIREALKASKKALSILAHPGEHRLISDAEAELDNAERSKLRELTADGEIERMLDSVADAATEPKNEHGEVSKEWCIAQNAAADLYTRLRDIGYLSKGLTVESITLTGEQPDPTGDIRVMVKLSDGTEVEAIRTCANSIYHMVTLGGILELRASLN